MPTITTDGQSLSIDGRRLWLVSGAVHYARIPRGLWGARLAAARDAGLNCIEAPVPWSRHEPRSGVFDFADESDLSEFIRMIGAMGMHCIVRAGPFIGDGYDLGGLPAWLMPASGARLRAGTPEFLQACSRYIAALCAQIKDQQASNPRKRSGPVVMLMSEYQWHCGDGAAGDAYLRELDRFFRENGINVPIVGAHNLFHTVEGQINAWTGRGNLHANMRQLRTALADQPPFVAGLHVGAPAMWTREPTSEDGNTVLRRAVEATAAGAQFSISPLCAGINFGFTSGRATTREGTGAIATDAHVGAPLDGAGRRGPTFSALRRVCSFASNFGRVFAGLDGAYQPVTVSLDDHPPTAGASLAGRKAAASRIAPALVSGGPICIESRGSQGSVVWVLGPGKADASAAPVRLTLSDGSTLSVHLGEQSVCWALLNVHLLDRATLDYCTLCAFALVGSVLVCFGPAGRSGVISINGSACEVTVPTGVEPLIEAHEGVTIVVCNERSIDATYVAGNALFVGASGTRPDGEPMPHEDFARIIRIGADGATSSFTSGGKKKVAAKLSRAAPTLANWTSAGVDDYVEGTSDRFAIISGPSEMQALGAAAGYGWLRLKLRSSTSRSTQAGFFEAADRLHLFMDGASRGIVGAGPGGAQDVLALPLRKGEQKLTILVDNLGRGLEGGVRAERKGLYGHIHRIAPFKSGSPKLASESPIRILSAFSPLIGVEEHDVTDAQRLTWVFQHRKKTPIILVIDAMPAHGIVVLNGSPIHAIEPGVRERIVMRDDRLTRGGNKLQIALNADVQSSQQALKSKVSLFEGVESLTEKAEWAFARWEPPARSRFGSAEGAPENGATARPRWWRGQFGVSHTEAPLFFDADGLSKGCLMLNGREIGRFWVSASRGKGTIPPQRLYYLPEPWLRTDGPNDLLIFDEHGRSPSKCRLVYQDL